MTWQTKKLGEVIKLEYGKPLPKSKRINTGPYPVYGANGEKDRSNEFYYDKLSIIIGRKGSAGEINLTEQRFWPLDVTYYVTFDNKKYDLKFIYLLLITLELPKLARGVKPGINRNDVYAIEIKVPEIEEQRRIVKILDEVFEKVAKAKENTAQNLKNSRELFESYLRNVFSNPEWQTAKLGEIVEIKGGGTPPTSHSEYFGGHIPWFTPTEIKDGKINFLVDSIRTVTDDGATFTSSAEPGAVLLTTRAGIGKVGILREHAATFNQGIKALIPQKNRLDSMFLAYWLIGNKDLLEEHASGTTFTEISRSSLQDLSIPITSLPEQKTIVKKLDELSEQTKRLESIYKQKLADLEELKKSVLKKAFAGEL